MTLLRLICIFASSVAFSCAYALDQLSFSVEQAEFSGWQIDNLDLSFDFAAEEIPTLSISIDKLKSAAGESFKEVEIECPFPSFQNVLQFNLIECQDGSFSAKHHQLGLLKGKINFLFNAEKEQFKTSITQLRIAKGLLNITANVRKEK